MEGEHQRRRVQPAQHGGDSELQRSVHPGRCVAPADVGDDGAFRQAERPIRFLKRYTREGGMTPSRRGLRLRAGSLLLLCAAIPAVGRAQAREPSIPRGPDGKPDLSGIWQVVNSAAWDLQDHSAGLGLPPGQTVVEGGTIPYLPAAAAKQRDNFEHRDTDDPAEVTCYLPGVPRATYLPFPFELIQHT